MPGWTGMEAAAALSGDAQRPLSGPPGAREDEIPPERFAP